MVKVTSLLIKAESGSVLEPELRLPERKIYGVLRACIKVVSNEEVLKGFACYIVALTR